MASKTTSVQYQAAWLKGFKAAIYEGADGMSPTADAVSLAMGNDGGSIGIIDTAGERRGYSAGFTYGQLVAKAFQAGFFPDLENALRGGSVLGVAADAVESQVFDTVSDPVGELGDFLGLTF